MAQQSSQKYHNGSDACSITKLAMYNTD